MKKLDSKKILTQEEMILRYHDHILCHGQVFEKFKAALIRPGIIGEVIETIVADGLETRKVVGEDEYVVQSLTKARETYVISGIKFRLRYRLLEDKVPEEFNNQGYGTYQSLGQIKAVAAKTLMEGDEAWFIADRGEKMRLRPDDMLAQAVGLKPELYRIAIAEFLETYKVVEK